MLTKTLAAIAAVSMLVAGGSAFAAQKSATTIGPKQPIPYSQLNAYLKASPKARVSKDWWAGSASTGMQTDTAATAPPMPTADTAVNPSTMTAPPSLPVTPPIDATPLPSDPTKSSDPAPGAPAAPPVTPPTEPK